MARRRYATLLGGLLTVASAGVLMVWRAPTADPGTAAEVSTVESPTETLALPEPESAAATLPGATLRDVVAAAERAAAPGMTLGIAVLDLNSGELAAGANGTRQFYSASLAKLIVAVDLLDRGLTLTDADLDLVTRALRASDDDAMNTLWSRFDGPGAITRVATRLNLTGTKPPDDPTQWGETLITPTDFTRLYQHILRDLTPAARALIVNPLTTAQPTAADGFDQFFGLLLNGPTPTRYAKQGWMTYVPATTYLHSAGIAHNYAITLLSQQPTTTPTARAHLSTVASAVLTGLGSGAG